MLGTTNIAETHVLRGVVVGVVLVTAFRTFERLAIPVVGVSEPTE
jgi:hypothetical protein